MAKLSPYTSVSQTRAVLQAHGLATKHSLGQNFLINDGIVQKIIDLAQVEATDDILEIGPGIGTLSVALLQRAHSVIAIECDPDLPAVLAQTTLPWVNTFALIQNDALKVSANDITRAFAMFDAASVGEPARTLAHTVADTRTNKQPISRTFPNKLVANLPYAIAATVVLDYFERFESLESMTVMVQHEVADRMMAQTGTKDYGAFTVKLSLYATPAGRFAVTPGNFFPPPRVQSAVLRLNRVTTCDAQGNALSPEDVRAACIMADAAFATRRKTIANSCKTYFMSRGERGCALAGKLSDVFQQAGIDARRRGETLSREEFIALGRAYLLASE